MVAPDDPSQFRILFGTITARSGNRLTVTIRNEITDLQSPNGPAAEDIMNYGIGFPKYFTPIQQEINHDDIIAFRPVSKVSTRLHPPKTYAGQNAGSTLLLLGAMIAGIVLLF